MFAATWMVHAHTHAHTLVLHTHSSSSYTGQCQSMATQLQQLNANLSHHLVAGASCIGQTARGRRFNDGYCDQLQRCREIDPDDALVSQLLNLLRQYTSVAEWMRAMWWLVVLVCVGILIALNVIVTVCHFSLRKADGTNNSRGKKGTEQERGKVRGAPRLHQSKVIRLQPKRNRVSPVT